INSSRAAKQSGRDLDAALQRLADFLRQVAARPAPPLLGLSLDGAIRLVASIDAGLTAAVLMAKIPQLLAAVKADKAVIEEQISTQGGPPRCAEAVRKFREATAALLEILNNPGAFSDIRIAQMYKALSVWRAASNAAAVCLGRPRFF